MWDSKPDIKSDVKKGKIEKFFKHYMPVAVELFSSAWCNLDCSYCYIPKHSQFIKDLHKEIKEKIKDGTFIEKLQENYGDKLEAITHWGTEPTLTLEYFDDFYKKALKTFPKLKTISLSSNFMTNPEILVNFIKNLPNEKKLTIDVQMSLDGPHWITDENRRQGTTDKIIENIVKFIEKINKYDIKHKIQSHFKPTVTSDQFNILTDEQEVFKYYLFFDLVLEKMFKVNTNNIVNIIPAVDPTIVCPGEYTKQDGVNFNKVYLNQFELGKNNRFKYIKFPDSNYYERFCRVMNEINEVYTKHLMFTCSAGDSQFGIDHKDQLHPCHDTFYVKYDEYKKALEKDTDRLINEDVMTKTSILDFMSKKWVYNEDSDIQLLKYLRRNRSYHDFLKQKIAAASVLIYEMMECNQISNDFKDKELLELFALFLVCSFACPTNSIANYGSLFILHHDYIRLFGNGLFQNFVKRYINEKNI